LKRIFFYAIKDARVSGEKSCLVDWRAQKTFTPEATVTTHTAKRYA
jgi:predicted carbohydrate-binding protein with CBM5 and CBM33 domain